MSRSDSQRRWLASQLRRASALAAALALAAGCSGPGPEAPAGPAEAARQYRVRGVVERLPDEASARPLIFIHHEEIPEFVGPSGKVTGMEAMTMPFAIAPGVDVSSLRPGDAIEFELEVDWESEFPGVLTGFELLPEEAASPPEETTGA